MYCDNDAHHNSYNEKDKIKISLAFNADPNYLSLGYADLAAAG